MKNSILIFLVLVLFSCENSPVAKPKNLLDEEVMENILYDVAILQAAEVQQPMKLRENNISLEKYIYKKYKIDSTTFYQNNKYYASNVKKYKKMFDRINNKITERLSKVDTLLKKKGIAPEPEMPNYVPTVR